MTNDAAVAWVSKLRMQYLRDGWSTTCYGPAWAQRSDISDYEPLYSATTVAELRAEVERLQALSAAISRDCNECANQRNGANAKAAAAERRVAELEAGVSVLAKRWRAEAVKLREQAGRALRRENAGYFPAVPHSELASAANDADSYAAELEALTKESP